MEPLDIVNDICRYYIADALDVNAGIVKIVDGYRRSRNYPALASCSLHFDLAMHSINEWRFLRQVEAFYKKNALFAVPEVCTNAAKVSFFEAEEQCSETNRRLKVYIGKEHLLDEPFRSYIFKMELYISRVLGDFHSFLEALPSLVKVTSGATAHSTRKMSLPQRKLKLKLFATRRAQPYLKAIYHHFGFKGLRVKTCHTNRVETVPKNWKTARTIGCEPEGNLPLQLAFDSYAKRRLRRYGINLADQFCNQKAALEASKIDGDVTVDFKAASDTVSYNPVVWLFPPDWVKFLTDVRSPSFRGVFGDGLYSKFSSMGNGSTFTIETLLFAAACHAVGARKFLVYGDDVIIPKQFYEPFTALTRFLGFTINRDKSFASGPFRESCGMDAYNGIDVTPVFIRQIDSRKAILSHLVNTIARLTYPGSKLGRYLEELIKEHHLPLVPYQESTISGVWIDPDIARDLGILSIYHKVRGKMVKTQVSRFKSYVPKSTKTCFFDSRGYYLWFLAKRGQVGFPEPWLKRFSLKRLGNSTVSFLAGSSDVTSCVRPTQTTSAPVFQHAFVRKRVVWVEPDEDAPDHLYWWSGSIYPPKGRK